MLLEIDEAVFHREAKLEGVGICLHLQLAIMERFIVSTARNRKAKGARNGDRLKER